MRYSIIHRTSYAYGSPVMLAHYLARLAPRQLPHQECPWHEVEIRPRPATRATRVDYFGNSSHYFEIEGSHDMLDVVARSLVEIRPPPEVEATATPAWETVRDSARHSV
ncbi:MAG: transglutaminase family protein, partial [Verrucomicrobiales bacterium]|nr:transglutaminase family protein [Verrucomicrobiales bacterium]